MLISARATPKRAFYLSFAGRCREILKGLNIGSFEIICVINWVNKRSGIIICVTGSLGSRFRSFLSETDARVSQMLIGRGDALSWHRAFCDEGKRPLGVREHPRLQARMRRRPSRD